MLSHKTKLEELIQSNENKASNEKTILEQRVEQKENEKTKLHNGNKIC